MTYYLMLLITFLLGLVLGYYWHKTLLESKLNGIERHAQEIIKKAEMESEHLLQTLKQEYQEKRLNIRTELEQEFKERRKDLERLEERLDQRAENIQRQSDLLSSREEDINRRLREHDQRLEQFQKREEEQTLRLKKLKEDERLLKEKIEEAEKVLEKNAGMSKEDAKRLIINSIMDEAKTEAARHLKAIEEETQEKAEKEVQRILAIATQRYTNDYVSESTVSVVHLPNDDMKGRIIGREGRNIRALEAATGVDLIIDDTPEAVVISCFNPIRREIARRSLEKLVSDGRIHPARIEEIVEKTSEEMDSLIKEAGEEAVLKLGLHKIHPELKKLLGQLKWRYSYGQNQWDHSIECGILCGLMAAELKLNVKQARRAALLHDIGKALTYEMEGSHALNGANIAQKYGESPEIVHAIAAHHEEIKPKSPLAYLVIAADTLSGGRPGARREALESYIQRLHDLEEIAVSFSGVCKAYAIQAGREIRVIAESDKITDEQTVMLCRDISQKIEREMTYPGQIKVTVIRELRVVDYAR